MAACTPHEGCFGSSAFVSRAKRLPQLSELNTEFVSVPKNSGPWLLIGLSAPTDGAAMLRVSDSPSSQTGERKAASLAFSTLPPEDNALESLFGKWLANHLKTEREAALQETDNKFKAALENQRQSLLADLEEMLSRQHQPEVPATHVAAADDWRHRQRGPEHHEPSSAAPGTSALDVANPQISGQKISSSSEAKESKASGRKTRRFRSLEYERDHGGDNLCARLVHTVSFELCSMTVIILNTLLLAAEVQYTGYGVGHDLGVSGFQQDNDESMPWARSTLTACSAFFVFLFMAELLVRIIGLGLCEASQDIWMWLDGGLVVFGVLDLFNEMGISLSFGINPTTLRLLRLLRLTRILKRAASIEAMQSLFLLIKSLKASASALLWAIVILVIIMTLVGLFTNQMVYDYMMDEAVSIDDRTTVFNYFGTYSLLMVTMFEITVGNWIVPARILMEIHEVWGTFIVVYRCVFCFAVVNVIRAVFITETQRVAANDDEVAMIRRERLAQSMVLKLNDVFVELDKDGDGKLTMEEFEHVWNDRLMKQFLSTLELEIVDLTALFHMLDDGDQRVDCDEFIHGVTAMKGWAKGSDLVMVLSAVRRIERTLDQMFRRPTQFRPHRVRASQHDKPETAPVS